MVEEIFQAGQKNLLIFDCNLLGFLPFQLNAVGKASIINRGVFRTLLNISDITFCENS